MTLPYSSLNLENYQTKVVALSDEKKKEILEMGSDVFLNLEALTSQNEAVSEAVPRVLKLHV